MMWSIFDDTNNLVCWTDRHSKIVSYIRGMKQAEAVPFYVTYTDMEGKLIELLWYDW